MECKPTLRVGNGTQAAGLPSRGLCPAHERRVQATSAPSASVPKGDPAYTERRLAYNGAARRLVLIPCFDEATGVLDL